MVAEKISCTSLAEICFVLNDHLTGLMICAPANSGKENIRISKRLVNLIDNLMVTVYLNDG